MSSVFNVCYNNVPNYQNDLSQALPGVVISDDSTNSLYEKGGDVGTLSSFNRFSEIGFDREATTLQETIRSAIVDLRYLDLNVDHVEIEERDLVR